jgi:hypothetical protein
MKRQALFYSCIPHFRPYVLSFFASCGVSLVVSVLVIIYAATGLARDSGFPGGFIRDSDSGELVPVSQINLPTREVAMIVNLLLIILGVLVRKFNICEKPVYIYFQRSFLDPRCFQISLMLCLSLC